MTILQIAEEPCCHGTLTQPCLRREIQFLLKGEALLQVLCILLLCLGTSGTERLIHLQLSCSLKVAKEPYGSCMLL